MKKGLRPRGLSPFSHSGLHSGLGEARLFGGTALVAGHAHRAAATAPHQVPTDSQHEGRAQHVHAGEQHLVRQAVRGGEGIEVGTADGILDHQLAGDPAKQTGARPHQDLSLIHI